MQQRLYSLLLKVPNIEKKNVSSETKIFINSIQGHAICSKQLPRFGPVKDEAIIWWLIGELCYIKMRHFEDPNYSYDRARAKIIIDQIVDLGHEISWPAIAQVLRSEPFLFKFNRDDNFNFEPLLDDIANELVPVASQWLSTGEEKEIPYQKYGQADPIIEAIKFIKIYGSEKERETLLEWAEHGEYGQAAMSAVETIMYSN